MNQNNKKLEVEKLNAEIERLKKELKKRKKYGLVWEEKPEELVEMCKEKLPVLKEIKNKEIITDKDKTVNLLIEGDNYHALSVLNYTHAKKVDVIYIDPPYNTGNKDFIFNDHYVDKEDAYRHSKWLAFMEKRLKLAKNLLKDIGVIFISIDDNEVAQLKLLCDEIFDNQLLGIITWRSLHTVKNDAKNFSINTEFVLCYTRGKANQNIIKNEIVDKSSSYPYDDKDGKGLYKLDPIYAKSGTESGIYTYTFRNGIKWKPSKGTFPRYSIETLKQLEKDNEIIFSGKNKTPMAKRYLSKVREGIKVSTYWDGKDVGFTMTGDNEVKNILGEKKFQNPKPTGLIKRLIKISLNKTGIVLDFMAGTGTTGHAVLELNKEDGGNRKFVLCTNNENNNGNGYKIAEDICYPRIKKVIGGYKNLKGEKVEGLGGNLKYFKTAFVDYDEPTDRNKIKLTEQATEMLCVREGTFEKVRDNEKFKIFKNSNHYTGIIWDQTAIPPFKKAIKDIKGKFSVYVFSLGDETFEDEFKDIKQKIQLSPIPEAILRVYRRIFK